MKVKMYHDNFGNTATIEEKMILPYRNSPKKELAFVLSCMSDYDNYFMYHRSVHDCEEHALRILSEFSCGTFKETKYSMK